MTNFSQVTPSPPQDAHTYQDSILPQVSRTFALTIPQLPPALRCAVTNAYLLCRVADTIEDEPAFSARDKRHYENAFVDAVTGRIDPQSFAAELAPQLSAATLEAERELMHRLPLVLEVTRSLKPVQRAAIVNCLKVMCRGMSDFQRDVSLHGLGTLRDLDRYCYCVAGVVGEMLTELFIDFEPALAIHRNTMLRLAVSFGQGLQMTNILKDQWEDRDHGTCWLPQDVFAKRGVQLRDLRPDQQDANCGEALTELIGIAHTHLRHALDYTLLIPARQTGLRRFCLWSLGLAVLTLRNLHHRRGFSRGAEVKISHGAVALTIVVTRLASKSDAGLRRMFTMVANKLPQTPLGEEWSKTSSLGPVWASSAMATLTPTAWRESEDVNDR